MMREENTAPDVSRAAALNDLVLPDRRHYSRYTLRRRALMRLNSGHIIEVQTHDLALGGMQVYAHPLRAFLLHPSDELAQAGRAAEFDARVALPLGKRIFEFRGRAVVAYTRPLSADRVALGLRFIDVVELGVRILRLFEKRAHQHRSIGRRVNLQHRGKRR